MLNKIKSIEHWKQRKIFHVFLFANFKKKISFHINGTKLKRGKNQNKINGMKNLLVEALRVQQNETLCLEYGPLLLKNTMKYQGNRINKKFLNFDSYPLLLFVHVWHKQAPIISCSLLWWWWWLWWCPMRTGGCGGLPPDCWWWW